MEDAYYAQEMRRAACLHPQAPDDLVQYRWEWAPADWPVFRFFRYEPPPVEVLQGPASPWPRFPTVFDVLPALFFGSPAPGAVGWNEDERVAVVFMGQGGTLPTP